MNEWISVDDEFPKLDAPVLYYFEATGIAVGKYHGCGAFGGGRGYLHDEVTHWMPTPEIPSTTKEL